MDDVAVNGVRRRLLAGTILVLGSLALYFGCAALCRAHNDFPVGYQPDEESKAEQLIGDHRNFHHPLLLLDVADAMATWQRTPNETTPIVQVGRDASAMFGGAAAVMIGWAGLVAEGWIGFGLLGVAAAVCPAVISHAHYFKEDAALIFGLSCVVFAGALLCRAKRAWSLIGSAILLGAACGVAASGKYAGAVFAAPALLMTIAACGRRWIVMPIALLLLAAAAAGTWAGLNAQAIHEWERFRESLGEEEEHSITDHLGTTMDRPNGFFINEVMDEASPPVAALCIAAPILLLLQRRGTRMGFWLILLGGTYLAALSYSVIPFYRYAIPVTLLLHLLAAMSVVWAARLAVGRPMLRGAVVGLGLGVLATTQLSRCLDYDEQFGNDSRTAMRQWIAAAVAPGALIAADDYTLLGGLGMQDAPRVIRSRNSAAQIGSVEGLRRRGFAYIITAGSRSERYLIPYTRGADNDFDRCRVFYETLQRNPQKYPVVWQTRAADPMRTFANPDITVYRLFSLHNSRP